MAGIYIHIPYCRKMCAYCDFYHVMAPPENSAYISTLLREAILRKDYVGNETVSTIYLGGGTPSLFSVRELDMILKEIERIYKVDQNSEVTVEINPDDITPGYAMELKETRVNRISLGVQSWRDADLKLLNRRHDSAQAAFALEELLKAGFTNVSVDLIYGIPGMTLTDLTSNLDKTFAYGIQHLSAYHLTIEPGTMFWKMREKGLFTEIDEEESTALFNLLIEKAASAGFVHYEISNFGKPGFFSIHNSNYWKQVRYLGLGPAAHSFNGYSRQWNVRDVRKYIKSVSNGEILFEREELDRKTRFNEYIMTSLRTMWGIDLDYVEKTFDKEGYDYLVNLAGKYINYGLMKQEKNTLVLTNQGKMISDNVISELMLPQD